MKFSPNVAKMSIFSQMTAKYEGILQLFMDISAIQNLAIFKDIFFLTNGFENFHSN
jgi:hypothetical protein